MAVFTRPGPRLHKRNRLKDDRDQPRRIGDSALDMSKLKCPNCGADIGSVLAAHAGSATSKAKAAAARQNAKKGGWPKGRPRKTTPVQPGHATAKLGGER